MNSLDIDVRELSQSNSNNESFFVIRHRLKKAKPILIQYENWLKKVVPIAANFPGHLGVQIARPPDGHNEYLIIVHSPVFMNYNSGNNLKSASS
jgi:uncharacterized protein